MAVIMKWIALLLAGFAGLKLAESRRMDPEQVVFLGDLTASESVAMAGMWNL